MKRLFVLTLVVVAVGFLHSFLAGVVLIGRRAGDGASWR